MQLVIVESPTKAKTISKFLGDDFIVASSFGHVRDLPKSELGIDTDNDFEPAYVIPTKAKKNVSALKKQAARADGVILATDEDREGEAISWHLVTALGLDKLAKKNKDFSIQRIVFHEITKSAIEHALAHPREIDTNLVNAQQARRVLDRLVGYKLSPMLWKRFFRGLSAGRVQSVAVRCIVEREREIQAFVPEEYWSVTANLQSPAHPDLPLEAALVRVGETPMEKLSIKNEQHAQEIVSDLTGADWTVAGVERQETSRLPHAPFITSTLQQDSAKKLHFSSKQTMMFAQQLYEAGYITYMRTDSVNLSEESMAKAKSYIEAEFGANYYQRRRYKTKAKGAQEAHEAIRPTEPARTPEQLSGELSPQQAKLYDLIWRRFTASQMANAAFDASTIDIAAKHYTFRATGTVLKFDGFLRVYPTSFEERSLPELAVNDALQLAQLVPEQHFTKPPARYNEASLIKLLEKEGIGRPSTYASIISTILARKYVEKDRSRAFHPTEIGTLVTDFLVEHFPAVVDTKFTSHMEDELDDIAAGSRTWVPVVREFFDPFARTLSEKADIAAAAKEKETEETDKICEKCGSTMVVKRGRFGKFIACSNFPECKNVLKEKKAAVEVEKTGEKCPEDGGDLIFRIGRFGKFIACSNFPKCKYTAKIKKEKAADSEAIAEA